MSKIVVQKCTETQTSTGKTKYKCIGTIDGELEQFEMWDKPELDQEFEGTVKDDPKWGKSVSTGSRSGGGGGGSRFNDPETRKEIIRQSSLAQAVAFATKKVEYMEREDALEYLNGKQVLQIATYFAAYAEGRLTVAMSEQDVIGLLKTEGSRTPAEATKAAQATPAEKSAKLPFDREPEPGDPDGSEDINPDEVPL